MSISATVTSQPISASVSGDTIAASVPAATGVAANVTGGVGPAGPAGSQGPAGATGPQGETGPAGASGASNWSEIAGKPETFPPASHAATHATGGGDALSAADIGAAAANHSHTYASLTAKPIHPYAAQLLLG